MGCEIFVNAIILKTTTTKSVPLGKASRDVSIDRIFFRPPKAAVLEIASQWHLENVHTPVVRYVRFSRYPTAIDLHVMSSF